jgi:hypothetical protein
MLALRCRRPYQVAIWFRVLAASHGTTGLQVVTTHFWYQNPIIMLRVIHTILPKDTPHLAATSRNMASTSLGMNSTLWQPYRGVVALKEDELICRKGACRTIASSSDYCEGLGIAEGCEVTRQRPQGHDVAKRNRRNQRCITFGILRPALLNLKRPKSYL